MTTARPPAVCAAAGALSLLALLPACAGSGRRSSCGPPFLTVHAGRVSGDVGGCAGQYTTLGTAQLAVGTVITVAIYHSRTTKEATLPQSTAPSVVAAVSRSGDGRSARFRVLTAGTADLVVPTMLCPRENVAGTAAPGASPARPANLCRILRVEAGG